MTIARFELPATRPPTKRRGLWDGMLLKGSRMVLPMLVACSVAAAEFDSGEHEQKADRETVEADSQAAVTGRVSVILSEAATVTSPGEADYDDALVTAVGTITKGDHKGQQIKVVTLGMRDRKLLPVLKHWRNGTELELRVCNLEDKKKAEPDLARTDKIDEVEDLTMVEHWADFVTP